MAGRGHRGMLAHRLRRLALPFAVFWPILIVCTTVLMLVYLHLMAYGTAGIEVSLLAKKSTIGSPFNTMHMWFIYYLIWFCALTALLGSAAARLPAGLRQGVDTVFQVLATRWWGLLLLTTACLLTYQVLVRHTVIGVLLNGRRQARAVPVSRQRPSSS